MNLNLKNLVLAIAFSPLLVACNNNNKDASGISLATDSSAHAHSFRCPMNCEKGKTYDKEGDCPICGMKLERCEGVDTGLTYKMQVASA